MKTEKKIPCQIFVLLIHLGTNKIPLHNHLKQFKLAANPLFRTQDLGEAQTTCPTSCPVEHSPLAFDLPSR